jgi:Ser/Thr protein kinase RdoA (MazF antagonist)
MTHPDLPLGNDVGSADAGRLAAATWGIKARAEPLPGWEDANFLLRVDDRRFVLKISPVGALREALEYQASMLLHLASGELASLVPRPVPTREGRFVAAIETARGTRRMARLLTFLEGRPLVEIETRPPGLLSEIGATLALLDLALTDFVDPSNPRTHEWDLMATPELAPLARHIDDLKRRRLVELFLERFLSLVRPRRTELAHGVIHADANDHNLLVAHREEGPHLAGIIDFSDLQTLPIVADLAISLAYLMLDRDDPFADAEHVIRGYSSVRPLTELERELLPDLVIARICASVLHAARGHARDPANAYLQISAAPMWRLIERLGGHGRERFTHALETASS